MARASTNRPEASLLRRLADGDLAVIVLRNLLPARQPGRAEHAGSVGLGHDRQVVAVERVSGAERLIMGSFIGFADDSLGSAVAWG